MSRQKADKLAVFVGESMVKHLVSAPPAVLVKMGVTMHEILLRDGDIPDDLLGVSEADLEAALKRNLPAVYQEAVGRQKAADRARRQR